MTIKVQPMPMLSSTTISSEAQKVFFHVKNILATDADTGAFQVCDEIDINSLPLLQKLGLDCSMMTRPGARRKT